MIAVSILEKYNAKHIDKLNDYINLHVFDSIPSSGVSSTFAKTWGSFFDVLLNYLSMDCPDTIFWTMSDLLNPQPIRSGSSEYGGIDTRTKTLSCSVSQSSVGCYAPYVGHHPMSSGSLGVNTTALSLEPHVYENDVHHSMYAIIIR